VSETALLVARTLSKRGNITRDERIQLAEQAQALMGEVRDLRAIVAALESTVCELRGREVDMTGMRAQVEELQAQAIVTHKAVTDTLPLIDKARNDLRSVQEQALKLTQWQARAFPALTAGRIWLVSPYADGSYNTLHQALTAFWSG
jgi:hypothetical protein